MAINIRKAGFTDIYNIYCCNKAVLPIYYSIEEYLFIIFASTNKELLVAEIDDELVGYLLAEYDGSFLHIMSFGVYPKYRRHKIGTKLIHELVNIAKNKPNVNTLSLNVHADNKGGVLFYEKYGFKKNKRLVNYYSGTLKNAKSQDAFRLEYLLKHNDKL